MHAHMCMVLNRHAHLCMCAPVHVHVHVHVWGHAHHAVLAQGGLELRELLSEALEVGPTRLARHDQLVLPD